MQRPGFDDLERIRQRPVLRILGIESSCDETAAAVVCGDGTVLSDVVRSQAATHAKHGGVVPEVASRDHLRVIEAVVSEALQTANVHAASIDAIAVTCRPGLVGGLLVGLQFAKTLSWAWNTPLVGVDHLFGHLVSPFLRRQGELLTSHDAVGPTPLLPMVSLLVSGGHTAIYLVDALLPDRVTELGATRDDAAGEAYDKVAKLLGLGYPGGPIIDKLAQLGDPRAVPFTAPMPRSEEFSFSGLKTQVARYVQLHGGPTDGALADVCASFQRAVVDSLATKLMRAAEREGVNMVTLGGGVAANSGLAVRIRRDAEACNMQALIPSRASATDNAAMIAYAGALMFAAGARDDLSLSAHNRTAFVRNTRKGRGPR